MEQKNNHHHDHAHCHSGMGHNHKENVAIDPVCGMEVDTNFPKGGKSLFEGNEYFFCNPKCKAKFEANPHEYLHKKDLAPVTEADLEKIYTCPMHPEIRQKGPGNCPICGMALEPEEVSLDEEENPELVDFTRRLKVSVALSVPLLLLAMSDLIPGQPVQHAFPHWLYAGLQFLLATPVVLWAGLPFFERGWASVKTRNLNMFTLANLHLGKHLLFLTRRHPRLL